MAKTLELLLTENVDNLGIVGDVVRVRTGYARNFLLPRELATEPSEELIKGLTAKRADAERMLAEQRQARTETVSRLAGFELTMNRACNDMGILYGAVTQQEIAAALHAAGYGVRPRDVRLSGAIKRVDNYDIHIKFEQDLETTIKLHVKPDRLLEKEEREEMDFDNEGNLITPERRAKLERKRAEKAAAAAAESAAAQPEAQAEAAATPAPGVWGKPVAKMEQTTPSKRPPKGDTGDGSEPSKKAAKKKSK